MLASGSRRPQPPGPAAIGISPAWRAVVDLAQRAANIEVQVLVTGESGSGKDVVARLIHAHSKRAHLPYAAINCAGVTESLLESELFGHKKGSFTGAWRDTDGLVHRAHGGTLFLDEIGETSLHMQAVLLRFVETGEVQQVGHLSGSPRVDTRIVAATNRNLQEMVAAGRFREDLFYRLCVIQIHVPPLRERPEDIWPLVEHVLSRQSRRMRVSTEARRALERHRWPGNVRELQNVVEQAVWMSRGDTIELDALPANVQPQAMVARPARERRRTASDRLFEALVSGRCSFWGDVHGWFLARDLTRNDLRGVISLGLAQTHGNYRALLTLFKLPQEDYKRFLNFLSTHQCNVDVQPYRDGTANPRERGSMLPFEEASPGAAEPGHERSALRSA